MRPDASHELKHGRDGLLRCTGCGALPQWPIIETTCDKGLNKAPREASVTPEQYAEVARDLRAGVPVSDIAKRMDLDVAECNRVGRAEGLVRNKAKTRRDKKPRPTEK